MQIKSYVLNNYRIGLSITNFINEQKVISDTIFNFIKTGKISLQT